MRNFDGIIFDVDGTLTSTNQLIFQSFNHVTKKYINKTYTDEELIGFFGPTEEAILRDLTGDNFEDARNDYFQFYNEHHSSLADIYPGIKEALEIIKQKKVPLAVFTGKGREAAVITLKVLELFEYFDMIVTGDDVVEHKPSPEGILLFVDKFNLSRDKVLLIGDAPADIQAARAAGVKIASVVWDSYAKETVLESGSDYVFHAVEEMEKFLSENL